MGYTALYRKFRPTTFDDVKGQDAIVKTLKNQIETGRIGHAYLFCGTRGTGKTTVAKIFARAVNCEHTNEGSPCGECDTCRSIAEGRAMNVIEIDAASNNGVDNIREIREEVSYRPTEGKYKVYIIDEVHMLSAGAFNALLKTLEEPPEYVIFILATTEVHKIPVTILSRCQRYDFKRISMDVISDRLRELIDIEGMEAEDKAVRYIAKMADGAMRDALSLLDQCTAFYIGEKLTYENALEVLGAVDTDVFGELFSSLAERNVKAVIKTIDELVMQGRDISQLAADFTWYLRNLLLVKTSDDMEEVLDVSKETLERMKEEAEKIEVEELIRFLRVFSELGNQIKFASQKRVILEVTCIKLCRPQMEKNQDALLGRIRALEEKLENGVVAAAPEMVESAPVRTPVEPKKKVELPKAISEEVKLVAKDFRSISKDASPMIRNMLKLARLSVDNQGRLMIVMPDEMSATCINDPEHIKEILGLIEERTGKTMDVVVTSTEEGQRFEDSFADIEKNIHMEITVED